MSFKPINQIHQHLSAFHFYSQDRTRQVLAHHFCTHRSPDFHQCVIYDSDEADARLIGIEYIVSEKLFAKLPEEEKKFWHSHKYEVESGSLQLGMKSGVPGPIADEAEQPAMLELHKTYGKIIHTWAIDTEPDLPLGPPNLMMSAIGDHQLHPDLIKHRDEKLGISTEEKRKYRESYLPPYEKLTGADEWERTGKGLEFSVKEVTLVK